ncbi:SprT family zinc-dependent metalloprotease [Methylocystis sp. B8]|uniref:M48 family metallopeptidase n=1 Tax=Methylocystis sp. B8 TaxID=544938 RepID=UPI0010FF3C62|nr:SprT family zinc-dependent metalloprotease [Methylocystis sp. B8]TLG78112.1 M48 family metallopeptidase [Methylocystis sp. B8]
MLRLLREGPAPTGGASTLILVHAGETILVALRRSQNARRFTLRVRFAKRDAVLTMPQRAALRDARDFAQRHAAWIAARLNRLPETIPFAHGSVAPLRGVDHLIAHHPELRGVTWIEPREDFEVPFTLCVAGQAAHVHRRVQDHFKREARRDLEDAVARHTTALSLPPRGVGLRDTISRWGSCSASGALNFSWRLIMAPPFVLDYLAAHEVAHLAHLDHSPRFWKLTRRLCADTDRAEAWLSAHGAHLHKYGAKAR